MPPNGYLTDEQRIAALEKLWGHVDQATQSIDKIRQELEGLSMPIGNWECGSEVAEPLKRFEITSHNEFDTLAAGDTITWVDNGTLNNPNDRVNVNVVLPDGTIIDQGVSTQSGSFVLSDVPSGPIQICLQEMLFNDNDDFVGFGDDRCCYDFIGEEVVQNTVKTLDIPNVADSNVTDAEIDSWTGGNLRFFLREETTEVVVNGGQGCFRVNHEATGTGTQRVLGVCNLPNEQCYTVSETVTFDPAMTWGNGSIGVKIGWGLVGGDNGSGGLVTGGSSATSGWTARPTITEDANGNPCFTGYLYYANRPGMPSTGTVFGDEIQTSVKAGPGQTYEIKHQVCLNDAGQNNGEYRMWIDGALVINKSGIRWMDGTPVVDGMIFSSFHGGNTSSFNPSAPTYIDYKNVSVQTP